MNLGKTGVGDIVPAMFPIPQNPVTIAWNAYEAAKASSGVSGLGDFVPAFISIPVNPVTGTFGDPQGTQNPLRDGAHFNQPKLLERSSKNVLVDSMQRAKFSGVMGSGMGNVDITSLQAFEDSVMNGKSFGVSNLVLAGGGVFVLVMLMSGGKGRR